MSIESDKFEEEWLKGKTLGPDGFYVGDPGFSLTIQTDVPKKALTKKAKKTPKK